MSSDWKTFEQIWQTDVISNTSSDVPNGQYKYVMNSVDWMKFAEKLQRPKNVLKSVKTLNEINAYFWENMIPLHADNTSPDGYDIDIIGIYNVLEINLVPGNHAIVAHLQKKSISNGFTYILIKTIDQYHLKSFAMSGVLSILPNRIVSYLTVLLFPQTYVGGSKDIELNQNIRTHFLKCFNTEMWGNMLQTYTESLQPAQTFNEFANKFISNEVNKYLNDNVHNFSSELDGRIESDAVIEFLKTNTFLNTATLNIAVQFYKNARDLNITFKNTVESTFKAKYDLNGETLMHRTIEQLLATFKSTYETSIKKIGGDTSLTSSAEPDSKFRIIVLKHMHKFYTKNPIVKFTSSSSHTVDATLGNQFFYNTSLTSDGDMKHLEKYNESKRTFWTDVKKVEVEPIINLYKDHNKLDKTTKNDIVQLMNQYGKLMRTHSPVGAAADDIKLSNGKVIYNKTSFARTILSKTIEDLDKRRLFKFYNLLEKVFELTGGENETLIELYRKHKISKYSTIQDIAKITCAFYNVFYYIDWIKNNITMPTTHLEENTLIIDDPEAAIITKNYVIELNTLSLKDGKTFRQHKAYPRLLDYKLQILHGEYSQIASDYSQSCHNFNRLLDKHIQDAEDVYVKKVVSYLNSTNMSNMMSKFMADVAEIARYTSGPAYAIGDSKDYDGHKLPQYQTAQDLPKELDGDISALFCCLSSLSTSDRLFLEISAGSSEVSVQDKLKAIRACADDSLVTLFLKSASLTKLNVNWPAGETDRAENNVLLKSLYDMIAMEFIEKYLSYFLDYYEMCIKAVLTTKEETRTALNKGKYDWEKIKFDYCDTQDDRWKQKTLTKICHTPYRIHSIVDALVNSIKASEIERTILNLLVSDDRYVNSTPNVIISTLKTFQKQTINKVTRTTNNLLKHMINVFINIIFNQVNHNIWHIIKCVSENINLINKFTFFNLLHSYYLNNSSMVHLYYNVNAVVQTHDYQTSNQNTLFLYKNLHKDPNLVLTLPDDSITVDKPVVCEDSSEASIGLLNALISHIKENSNSISYAEVLQLSDKGELSDLNRVSTLFLKYIDDFKPTNPQYIAIPDTKDIINGNIISSLNLNPENFTQFNDYLDTSSSTYEVHVHLKYNDGYNDDNTLGQEQVESIQESMPPPLPPPQLPQIPVVIDNVKPTNVIKNKHLEPHNEAAGNKDIFQLLNNNVPLPSSPSLSPSSNASSQILSPASLTSSPSSTPPPSVAISEPLRLVKPPLFRDEHSIEEKSCTQQSPSSEAFSSFRDHDDSVWDNSSTTSSDSFEDSIADRLSFDDDPDPYYELKGSNHHRTDVEEQWHFDSDFDSKIESSLFHNTSSPIRKLLTLNSESILKKHITVRDLQTIIRALVTSYDIQPQRDESFKFTSQPLKTYRTTTPSPEPTPPSLTPSPSLAKPTHYTISLLTRDLNSVHNSNIYQQKLTQLFDKL